MGARLLPRGRNSDEGAHDWGVVARGDEKLHRETAGLQRALEREIRIADRPDAAPVAGSGGGVRARFRGETLASFRLSFSPKRRHPSRIMLANIRIQIIALSLFVAAAGFSPAIAQTQYSIGYPSPEWQYMLELINRARANGGAEATRLVGFANQGEPPFPGGLQEGPPSINGQSFTIANAAQPLSWNPLLATCAQNHAKLLNDNDQFFSGQSPHTFGGTTPEQRINAAGYAMNLSTEYNGPTTAGGFFPGPENVAENISIGSGPFTGSKLVTTILNQHNSLFTDQSVAGTGPSHVDDADLLARDRHRGHRGKRQRAGQHLGFALYGAEFRKAGELHAVHHRRGLPGHERQRLLRSGRRHRRHPGRCAREQFLRDHQSVGRLFRSGAGER